jgi:hypothetical protein
MLDFTEQINDAKHVISEAIDYELRRINREWVEDRETPVSLRDVLRTVAGKDTLDRKMRDLHKERMELNEKREAAKTFAFGAAL